MTFLTPQMIDALQLLVYLVIAVIVLGLAEIAVNMISAIVDRIKRLLR